MLHIKYIRKNVDAIKQAIIHKNINLDLDQLLELDDQRKAIQTQISETRAKRNDLAQAGKKGRPTPEQIETGKQLKADISKLEEKNREIDEA